MRAHFNLKQKIILLVAIPSFAFLFFTVSKMVDSFSDYREAVVAKKNITLSRSISYMIHEIQKERGRSAQFLKGTISEAELQRQRTITDKSIKEFEEKLPLSSIADKIANAHKKNLVFFFSARKIVQEKGSAAEALRLFSDSIYPLITLEVQLAKSSQAEGHEKNIMSVSTLEMAKENAGRLRATAVGIITTNKPISSQQQDLLSSYRHVAFETLNSPTLILSDNTSIALQKFQASDDWKKLKAIIANVIDKGSVGSYNEDPITFFDLITSLIDSQSRIIFYEQDHVLSELEEHQDIAIKQIAIMLGMVIALIIVIVALSMYFIKTITSPIFEVMGQLNTSVGDIDNSSQEIYITGDDIEYSSKKQGEALQSALSALDELSSMLTKIKSNTKLSQDTSERSTQSASEGQKIVKEMIEAIGEISMANESIQEQITISHNELEDIVKVIAEIGQKTNVINSIVFQLKLLSFNASVEAARAGDAGKGFAVVAEEVGNLAAMSGDAAKEITTVLDNSLRQVQGAVDNTKNKVGAIIDHSRSKVIRGTEIVKTCSKVLKQITRNVADVNDMIIEISITTNEQSSGMEQISGAMTDLAKTIESNKELFSKLNGAGKKLGENTQHLSLAVTSLSNIVN